VKALNYYIVDVFTDRNFGGNAAGVCPLDSWLPDKTLQNIAMENNLSETALFVERDGYYELRWFTPEIEVDLCGHATMASAYVLFNILNVEQDALEFQTQSGLLTVRRGDEGMLWLDFPSRPGVVAPNYQALIKAFGISHFETYKSADILVVVENEDTVRNLRPDFDALTKVKDDAGIPDDSFGVIVTAPGSDCDFVSRFFAPNAGIPEDPVTGRAHCVLTPYWSKRLGKTSLTARQLSKRGGQLWCEDAGERVKIGGKAVLYMQGEIVIGGR
jgi:PhzF family phenazine biosynthesis protein